MKKYEKLTFQDSRRHAWKLYWDMKKRFQKQALNISIEEAEYTPIDNEFYNIIPISKHLHQEES